MSVPTVVSSLHLGGNGCVERGWCLFFIFAGQDGDGEISEEAAEPPQCVAASGDIFYL